MKTSWRQFAAPVFGLLALTYLGVMLSTGSAPQRAHLIRFEAGGVMAHDPSTINRVAVIEHGKQAAFERRLDQWIRAEKSEAVASSTANAINLAVKFMHTADPVRVFMPDELSADAISGFGLDAPVLSVRLDSPKGVVLEADFGGETSGGLLHYMRVKGRPEYFLMSRFVLKEWRTVMGTDN